MYSQCNTVNPGRVMKQTEAFSCRTSMTARAESNETLVMLLKAMHHTTLSFSKQIELLNSISFFQSVIFLELNFILKFRLRDQKSAQHSNTLLHCQSKYQDIKSHLEVGHIKRSGTTKNHCSFYSTSIFNNCTTTLITL